jgi:hypothetical protein
MAIIARISEDTSAWQTSRRSGNGQLPIIHNPESKLFQVDTKSVISRINVSCHRRGEATVAEEVPFVRGPHVKYVIA